MNNHKEYETEYRIVAPKLWGADLFCNIARETEKAYLLVDVVQDTPVHDVNGFEEKGLMLRERWMAKSQITIKEELTKRWSFDFEGVHDGQIYGQRHHKEVE